MSSIRLIVASLLYHWRMNLAVGCGVVAGTAVLTGALLVGDSMRGSLRHLTLERLGRIDEVLVTDGFFREKLADELARQPEFGEHFTAAVPAIILRASLENTDPEEKRRANRVNLVGCDARFWRLWEPGPGQTDQPRELSRKQIVLNRPLADRLAVNVGDKLSGDVLLNLPDLGTIPGDTPLGKKTDTVKGARLTVVAIIPAEGPGRFSLRANQRWPLNAYMPLDGLQSRLGRAGRVNAVLVGSSAGRATLKPKQSHEVLGRLLRPTPTDYGIKITENEPDLPDSQKRGFRYISITSDRLLLEEETEAAISRTLKQMGAEFQPVFTYLANAIETQKRDTPVEQQADDGKITPYSTITAIDFAQRPPLGPFLTPDGDPIRPLDDKEGKQIVLNSWAADDLGVSLGDKIYVTYFVPESTHGRAEERTEEFELAEVAELSGPAADEALTPVVPGLTDKQSIDKWLVPFSPFRKKLIRPKDEDYFEQYGLTPKAFVSLATGQQLWGSPRFGRITGFRVKPSGEVSVQSLTEKLRHELKPDQLGFVFQPVRQQGLDASVGTMTGMMSFSGLFVALSFFVIASAVMLVALLFRLGIEQRAAQLGILAATGFTRRRVALLLAGEGFFIAALGSLVGVPVGVGYAALMLLGLRTCWRAAVVTPFVRLFVTPESLLIGFASGVIVALLAVVWAVWRTRRLSPRQLLTGKAAEVSPVPGRRSRLAEALAAGALIAAVAIGMAARGKSEEARAAAFFGAGALVLLASLTFVATRLRAGATRAAVAVGRGNLLRFAMRNAARNPGRSTLSIGLVAAACFLIVSLSAFQLDPSQQVPTFHSGNGGFALVVESDQPIYQHALKDLKLPAGTRTIAIRVRPGDDASCLNLYQPQQPRVLGVPDELINRGGFAWADPKPKEGESPWTLLKQDPGTDEDGTASAPVPVVIDKNTATYSLHLWKGVGETYDKLKDHRGNKIHVQVVGLLAGSIFHGDLLISETAFLRHFPEVSGYRFFLINTPPKETGAVRDALNENLGRYGLAVETTGERLARFLTVQNTYLLTFQSLGGLGLLLGTFGLAAVQLRNVLERRGELALLRAAGFRRSTLGRMVMLENGLLLLGGLASGLLAALVAVLPHLLTRAASIPWGWLGGTLAGVLAVGLTAGLIGVRAVLAAPLLAALREER